MKALQRFLKKNSMSIQQFADGINESHETARRYVHGIRTPRDPRTVEAILKFTKGGVTLADIYGVKTNA